MLGDKIREYRLQRGYTQEELAQKVGYKSKTTINKIELNINDIPLSKVEAFAKALGVAPSDLMGWEKEPAPTIDIGEELSALLARIEGGKSISHNGELLDDTSNALVVNSMTNMLKLLNALAKKA